MADDTELFVRLLGPVAGRRQERDFPFGTPRQQAILSILASCAGRIVPMSQLIDGVWGQEPPRSAEQSVYTYVAGLRTALQPDRKRREQSTLLIGTAGGYLLSLPPARIDSCVFADRLDRAHHLQQAGDHPQAVALLDTALELWQGPALSGVPGPFAEAERLRLEGLRVTAIERHADSMIQLSRHQEALSGLQDLTRRHPLLERPRELLMLALHRSGRRPEALEVYQEGRRVLADDLGVDPGQGLRECHELILRSDPESHSSAPDHKPRQLPRDLLGFVGRDTESIRLKSLLAPWGESASAPLVVISGPPGVGKSALAIRVSYLVKERFPDGQLYVNLRGATPGVPALSALDVLGRFLRTLGQPGIDVPLELDEAATAWRDMLDGRRVLIVLDDAADLAQILPLLSVPRGSSILVTSRETFAAADDCVQVTVAPMRDAEAVTVLAKLAGADRTSADPAATTRLTRLCDGLPLALRIVGARLADRPDWSVAAMTERLEDEQRRLHELEIGKRGVRSSLTTSWSALHESSNALDRTAARTLALMGLLRVPDVTTEVVAALLNKSPIEAEHALERLVDAHLLDCGQPGRYHLHDLVRLFAAELVTAQERDQALVRALSFYVATARSASVLRDPHRVQPEAVNVETAPLPLAGPEAALAWLMQEESNLLAAASQAMNDPDDEIARLGAALVFSVAWYQQNLLKSTDLISLNQQVLEVAIRLGDERMEMHAVRHVGVGFYTQNQAAAAIPLQRRELALCQRLGDRFGEQRALGNLSSSHVMLEEHEEALKYARAQSEIAAEIGTQVGVRYALLAIGIASLRLGRYDEASVALHQALARTLHSGDRMQEANVRVTLGELYVALGDPPAALPHLESGLERARAVSSKIIELRCLILGATAMRLTGALAVASQYIGEALALKSVLREGYGEKEALEEQAAIQAAYSSQDTITAAAAIRGDARG